MGGFFGTISKLDCVNDLFYGTDYNSHLGTKRAGMVTFERKRDFRDLFIVSSAIISDRSLRTNSTVSREIRALVLSATPTRNLLL